MLLRVEQGGERDQAQSKTLENLAIENLAYRSWPLLQGDRAQAEVLQPEEQCDVALEYHVLVPIRYSLD